jgi:hypothetical protein
LYKMPPGELTMRVNSAAGTAVSNMYKLELVEVLQRTHYKSSSKSHELM